MEIGTSKQARTQNARSIGEVPGRAVGEGEVGDVVEDAEYGESAESEEGVDPRPSQGGLEKLRRASGSAGSAGGPRMYINSREAADRL